MSPDTLSYDFAIIGGGVIGLAVAHALAEDDGSRRIVVIEAQTGSREASWAAAGMLAPYSEFHADMPLFHLCRDSLRMYPQFVAGLREETGLPCTFVDSGSLRVELEPDDAMVTDTIVQFLSSQRIPYELLEGVALHEAEPAVTHDVRRALWLPEASVNNRQLWDALAEACRRRGVELWLGTPVERVERTGDRLTAVHTSAGPVRAETVIVAAGAWSPALAEMFDVSLPVVPVKGHMLRLPAPDGLVRCTVHRRRTYIVPRPGFGIIVGSTMEDKGFDRTVDDRAIANLAAAAAQLVPALADYEPCETWTGLRPKPPDDAPILGRAPGVANLIVATGHFRNGILLTPITGRVIADIAAGKSEFAAFSPKRFTVAPTSNAET